MQRPRPKHLQLVEAPPVPRADRASVPSSSQSSLFVTTNDRLLLVVLFEGLSESEFLGALTSARPSFLVDLRVAPRFDLGSMNRRLVFTLFAQLGINYADLSGALGVSQSRDARLNPALLADQLRSTVFRSKKQPLGPLAFLVEPAQFADDYAHALADNLSDLSKGGWEVVRIPHFARPPQKAAEAARELVFISHATPDDNDFAKWLAAQLEALGYKVWVDVRRLRGGERFWDDIEVAIRKDTAKFIVGVSRLSQQRDGVLDEINVAVTVERQLALKDFVIPVRLDDLPFGDFRANIARKNIIDFHRNWADGLASIVEVLERDGVPRAKLADPDLAAMARRYIEARQSVSPEPETVLLNWALVRSAPDTLHHASFGLADDRTRRAFAHSETPHVVFRGGVISFAAGDELARSSDGRVTLAHGQEVLVEDFLAGNVDFQGRVRAGDARRVLSNLLRQAWSARAAALGMRPYNLSSRRVAWYPTKGLLPNDEVAFEDHAGAKRRKKLVGFSAKRQVFWHFGVEAKASIEAPARFVLRPHVVFSLDGKAPIESARKMHALRRGFCRSWWNDRWRDLTAAYLLAMSGGEEEIELLVGGGKGVRVSARMETMIAPVSVDERAARTLEDAALDDDPEPWDEDDETFSEADA